MIDPLQGQEAVQQFMKLLVENGQRGQAMDLSQLMWYMDGMNRQFEAVLAELQEVREQLAREKRPSVREHMENAVSALEEKALAVRDKLTGLWEKITQCAADAVRNFKEMGVSALDGAVSALGVKKALEAVQDGISGLAADTRKSIEKVEDMGHDLRSAGAHLKNVGRALLGKEAQVVNGGQEGRFQSVVLAPMRATQRLLSGMNNATLAAIGSTEHLEQRAAEVRAAKAERTAERPGKRLTKKPSVRQDLEAKKLEAAARAAAVPDREHKPPEAAL